MSIPVFRITGKPFDRGKSYGTVAAELIRIALGLYRRWFDALVGKPWELVQENTREFFRAVCAYDDSIGEEIEGIAAGAGLTVEDIMFLNARTELVYALTPECTAIGVSPPASRGGITLLAQNWDWLPEAGPTLVGVVVVDAPDGPNHAFFTEAGMVGKIGFNECGVGLVINLLGGGETGPGIPFHVLTRAVIKAETLPHALKAVTAAARSFSGNYLLGHRDGVIVDLETTRDDFRAVFADAGIMVHTNHFRWLPFGAKDRELVHYPDTVVRLGRVVGLLDGQRGWIGVDLLKRVLADHFGEPQSVCRHVDIGDDIFHRSATLFSIIMNLTERKFYVVDGQPCRRQYSELRFEDLFGGKVALI
jgi:isopenicillin-N N-acyltransferase-like protein